MSRNSGLVAFLGRWGRDKKQTAGTRRRVSIFGGGFEIKRPTMHVEAIARVISGRGFNSPRLQLVLRGNPDLSGFLYSEKPRTTN